jgi:aspartate-semialdehyde dehydrogenase
MSSHRDSSHIVIAGASSLLGSELKSLLEESRFAAADFRLLDEELAAGTLTEAGGEATILQPVEEGSFDRAQFIFFTGSPEFSRANFLPAGQSGARIIDLSGLATSLLPLPGTVHWFPELNALQGTTLAADAPMYSIPTAAATAVSALALTLAPFGLVRLVAVCLQSVSEVGRPGIEELETQTSQLLSFQSVGKPVFDAQVAFTLLDRFGPACRQQLGPTTVGLLEQARRRVRAEVKTLLAGKVVRPAVHLAHAPVFYGTVFAAWAELNEAATRQSIQDACKNAGLVVTTEDNAPSNVSVAGESLIHLAPPEIDPAQVGSWWFWGAADNIRLPAANAIKLADKLAS